MNEKTINVLLVLLVGRVLKNSSGSFKGKLDIWKDDFCVSWIYNNFYDDIKELLLNIWR